jgi:peptidoglycan hydrolase-like protein with peptidoglycan-binding domain
MQRDVGAHKALREGDRGDEVKALQRALRAAGTFKYPDITGNFGPITKQAVKDFQAAHGLRPTGIVNQKTLDALKANRHFVDDHFSTAATRGERGRDILGVERKLQAAGFDTGKVDGVFDGKTLKAVRGLRKADPTLADGPGVIDKAFVRALDKRVAAATTTDGTLASFNRIEPAHDYRHVTFRGATMNARTKEMLQRAESIMRNQLGRKDFRFEVTQGSYHRGVGASAGTHDGGGTLDIRTRGKGNKEIDDMVKAMRMAGFAAWSRGRGHDTFAPHIHAVALGDRELSGQGGSFGAFDQIPDYARGRTGLSSHARDADAHVGRPVPDWAKKYL